MNRPLLGFKLICLVVTLCYTYQGLLISPGLFYAPFILGFPLHTAAQRKSVWQLFSCNALERALLLEEQEPFRIFWKSVLYMYVGLLVALFLRGMTFTSVPQVASFLFFLFPIPSGYGRGSQCISQWLLLPFPSWTTRGISWILTVRTWWGFWEENPRNCVSSHPRPQFPGSVSLSS